MAGTTTAIAIGKGKEAKKMQTQKRRGRDTSFNSASNTFEKAKANLVGATSQCIAQAARDLARACASFKDDGIAILRAGLLEGINTYNMIRIREAAQVFIRSVDRSKMDFAQSTPSQLVLLSALNLDDAVADWAMDRFQAAHANTIRIRANTDKLAR
jgi:hypothetical protein